ncbi:DUF4167 domain-containing protein [Sphingomonas koreensis]
MINNRQANNGRRRGRGGQRQQGGGNPNQGNGNRIDNRARGNAAQLLEKYKNLARDAQLQGDRVNTEYYLQFADHYFRVLAESRSRFEDQNPGQTQQGRRPNTDIDGDDDDYEDGAEGQRGNEGDEGDARGGQDRYERAPRREEQREPRRDNRDRDNRGNRNDRNNDRGERRPAGGYQAEGEAGEHPAPANEDEAPRAEPRRRGRPRREEAEDMGDAAGIAAILPPALGVEGEAEAKPRRRRVKKDEEPAAAE